MELRVFFMVKILKVNVVATLLFSNYFLRTILRKLEILSFKVLYKS